MAALESQDEYDALVGELDNFPGTSSWTGLQALDPPSTERSNYRWPNGDATSEVSWWGNGQPDNRNGEEGNCVAQRQTTRAWDDVSCGTQLFFICERPGESAAVEHHGQPVHVGIVRDLAAHFAADEFHVNSARFNVDNQ